MRSSARGLGNWFFTSVTWVRIPYPVLVWFAMSQGWRASLQNLLVQFDSEAFRNILSYLNWQRAPLLTVEVLGSNPSERASKFKTRLVGFPPRKRSIQCCGRYGLVVYVWLGQLPLKEQNRVQLPVRSQHGSQCKDYYLRG